jgi:thiol-disulfide isomerase/thioredoxin
MRAVHPGSSIGAARWTRAVLAAAIVALWVACSTQRTTRPAPGVPAPSLNVVLDDMNGHPVNLASFKGHPLIVNFWATWCPPCKAEIPWFVDLEKRYKDQGLTILGVSVDDAPKDIQTFAAENKVNYPMLVGDKHDDFKKAFEAVDYIPVSWLIRADGTVLTKAQGIHPQAWFEDQVKTLVRDQAHD